MGHTQLAPWQINTRGLFSVKQILLSRGFEVTSESDVSKLLVSEKDFSQEVWKQVYNIFVNTSLRKELKDYLYKRVDPKSPEVQALVSDEKFIREYRRFDNTFEWFAGELMIDKFAAFSHSFGVAVRQIQRNSTGTEAGDYDCLVVLRDTNVAYFECKAGSFDSQSIAKCYERMLALNCQYCILFCVESIDEERLKWESNSVRVPITGLHHLNKFSIKGYEQDVVYELNNCYITDLSGSIENKIRAILRLNAAKINNIHSVIAPGNDSYAMLGYNVETIGETRY